MWPFKKQPKQVHVVEVQKPEVSIKRATGGKFRPGMWIVVGEKVGILKDMNEFGICSIMLVDEHGMNLVEMSVPVAELRQAKQIEIPKKRRSHVSPERLKRMGYE